MKAITSSEPETKHAAPGSGLRILGAGSNHLASAFEHWKQLPGAAVSPVTVVLESSAEALAALARDTAPVLIANLENPAVALSAAASGRTVLWVSTQAPQRRLGQLGGDIHGAWLEGEEVVQLSLPSGERTFWIPAGLPADLLATVLAGVCLGSVMNLPAHVLQKWIQSFGVTSIHPGGQPVSTMAIAA